MPEKAIIAFGLAVKKARNLKKLSQQGLADLTGISKRHIAKIESGIANPSFEIMAILAWHLSISIDQILYKNQFTKDDAINRKLQILLSHCNDSQKDAILNVIEILVKEFEKTDIR